MPGAVSFKRVLGRCVRDLEIFRSEARMLGDSRQHSWSDLLIIVKCEDKVWIVGARQGAM